MLPKISCSRIPVLLERLYILLGVVGALTFRYESLVELCVLESRLSLAIFFFLVTVEGYSTE